jgi:hypothetical protein
MTLPALEDHQSPMQMLAQITINTRKRRVVNSSGQIRGVKTCMTLPALEDD